ncbi:hypothetical protein EB118_20650 [bacterium]|nr:hypothetical protein [bacterium]NDD83640.1 hypothetical protein [bacterium]NDG32470.1 hypothetical protein [bacterium]
MDHLVNLYTQYTSDYTRHIKFNTIAIVIVICATMTYYFTDPLTAVVLFVFGVYVAGLYTKYQMDSVFDMNKKIMIKLDTLQLTVDTYLQEKSKVLGRPVKKRYTLDSMYINANLINFLYSILPLYDYNSEQFFLLLVGTNNLLKIQDQLLTYYEANGVYPHNTAEMFENALELRKKLLNNMHAFVFKNVNGVMPLPYIIRRYQVLITRVTDNIHNSYITHQKAKGIDNATLFVSYDETKPFDQYDNYYTIPHKYIDTVLQHYL